MFYKFAYYKLPRKRTVQLKKNNAVKLLKGCENGADIALQCDCDKALQYNSKNALRLSHKTLAKMEPTVQTGKLVQLLEKMESFFHRIAS